jgi:hypothetical protein
MKMLTAFAAISACRFADARQSALRHEDSSARTPLTGAAELSPLTLFEGGAGPG